MPSIDSLDMIIGKYLYRFEYSIHSYGKYRVKYLRNCSSIFEYAHKLYKISRVFDYLIHSKFHFQHLPSHLMLKIHQFRLLSIIHPSKPLKINMKSSHMVGLILLLHPYWLVIRHKLGECRLSSLIATLLDRFSWLLRSLA